MNKEIRIKTLEELINQPREIKFDTYEFDELSYTCLLCDIKMIILENQKYKEVIDKAIDKLYLWGETLNQTFQKEMLDVLKEVE